MSKERINQIFEIFEGIKEGKSLRSMLKQVHLSSLDFYKIIDSEDDLKKQYVRACEDRADKMFEEVLEIADEATRDTISIDMDGVQVEKVNKEVIERTKIRIDARKWMLGKMQPKKYGDKLDVTSDGEKINHQTIHVQIGDKEVNLKS